MIRNYPLETNGVMKMANFLFNATCRNGGPSSPIEWIMDNIEYLAPEPEGRSKLLIGFNMYAMSYLPTRAPEPLVMKTVLEKLLDQPKERMLDDELFDDDVPDGDSSTEVLNWDSASQEAWFVDFDEEGIRQGTVWLPTLRVRLTLIKSWRTCSLIIMTSLLRIG